MHRVYIAAEGAGQPLGIAAAEIGHYLTSRLSVELCVFAAVAFAHAAAAEPVGGPVAQNAIADRDEFPIMAVISSKSGQGAVIDIGGFLSIPLGMDGYRTQKP